MSFCEINDIRELKDFKGVTFSNFKKTDVQKELMTNLERGRIEPSCYWSSELICANHYKDLWEIIILFYSKYIHLANLKLAVYLELRIDNFKDIVNNGYSNFELNLRNNLKIRNLFCEIIYVICVSNRSHKYDSIKISKLEFNISNLVDKLKAPNTEFLHAIFKEDDPKDIFIAVNELSFHLSIESKNIISSCYWIEWLIEYDIMKRRKNEIFKCERRLYNVSGKYQQNIIWIIWDIFIHNSKSKSKLIEKTINACLNIFSLQYVTAINKKRKYLLYFVVSLLCENSFQESNILKDNQKTKLTNVFTNLDLIYEQIKKNEYSPQMDYLFENVKKNNLDNTIKKLETLQSFENSFIPRK